MVSCVRVWQQMGAKLGQAQPELGLGLKRIGLIVAIWGIYEGQNKFWDLQLKSNSFYFEDIALSRLNQTRLTGIDPEIGEDALLLGMIAAGGVTVLFVI